MKKIIYLLIIVPIFFSCHKKHLLSIKQINLPANGEKIIDGCNEYGFEVFNKMNNNAANKLKNIMYSPLSLNSVMLMAYNGASGTTAKEIQKVLNLQGISISDINNTIETINSTFPDINEDIELKIANSVWADLPYTIKPDFSATVKKYFQAEVQNLDFSDSKSLDIINNWVKDNTDGKIEKITDNLNMSLLIANTLYFKGKWHSKFNKLNTQKKDFYLADSSKISVPTMEIKENFAFTTSEKCIMVEMPYSTGNFVMDLVLPIDSNTTDSIINLYDLNEMLIDLIKGEITVRLPRFEFSYENQNLTNIIKQQIPTAFSDSANFSGLLYTNSCINKTIQKTYIKTDEEGTEAAAATGFSFMATSAMPTYINFNRPFIFIIREASTNTILFIGKVADPSKN